MGFNISVSFVGGLHALTPLQQIALEHMMSWPGLKVMEASHGDTHRSDEQMHDICLRHNVPVILHPSKNPTSRRFSLDATETRYGLGDGDRLRNLVERGDILLVCPEHQDRTHMSKWVKDHVKYARGSHTAYALILPDGGVELFCGDLEGDLHTPVIQSLQPLVGVSGVAKPSDRKTSTNIRLPKILPKMPVDFMHRCANRYDYRVEASYGSIIQVTKTHFVVMLRDVRSNTMRHAIYPKACELEIPVNAQITAWYGYKWERKPIRGWRHLDYVSFAVYPEGTIPLTDEGAQPEAERLPVTLSRCTRPKPLRARQPLAPGQVYVRTSP